MNLFNEQFVIGFLVGIVSQGIFFIIFKPLASDWAKNRIKLLNHNISDLTIKLRSIVKGQEIIYDYWQKAEAELKFIKARFGAVEKTNSELGKTIFQLSKEKSALQDERALLYIEIDKVKARLIKLTSPAYEKSGKVITEEGKVKNVSNRRINF